MATSATSASSKRNLRELIRSFEETSMVATSNGNKNNESSSSASSSSPISPLSIYKAGSIVYQIIQKKDEKKKNSAVDAQIQIVIQCFQTMLSSLSLSSPALPTSSSSSTLPTLSFHLRDIHNAFLTSVLPPFRQELLVKKQSSQQPTQHGQYSTAKQNFIMAIQSLCGIYVYSSLPKVCEIAFLTDNSNNDDDDDSDSSHVGKLCEELALLYYEIIIQSDNSKNEETEDKEVKECIISTLSSLLIHGLILPQKDNKRTNDKDDVLESIMKVIESMLHTNSTCLAHIQKWQQEQKNRRTTTSSLPQMTLVEAVQSIFPTNNNNSSQDDDTTTQREYLLDMLKSCRDDTKSTTSNNNNNAKKKNTTTATTTTAATSSSSNNTSKTNAIQRRIETVRNILPSLGEGYIEVALACYNHDVEQTTSALMEGEENPQSLHPRLSKLDKSLPIRRGGGGGGRDELNKASSTPDTYETFGTNTSDKKNTSEEKRIQEEKEAYLIQKRRMIEMEREQELEAYSLGVAMMADSNAANTDSGGVGEYDDDYDDQYDGIGDSNAADGGGMYDVDLDAIKAYNKVAKQMESERVFWEESKNTNRERGYNGGKGKKKEKDGETDEEADDNQEDGEGENNTGKKYRGPDKGKKGRLIGPDGKYLPLPKKGKKKGQNQNPSPATGKNEKGGTKSAGGANGGKPGQEDSNKMSKIQKRRKNDNKAKVANHHRKERALKKQG